MSYATRTSTLLLVAVFLPFSLARSSGPQHLWSNVVPWSFDGLYHDQYVCSVDPAGSVFIAATLRDSDDFGSWYYLNVGKCLDDGSINWTKRENDLRCLAMATDSGGNAILVGIRDIWGQAKKIFISKYESNGEVDWSHVFEGNASAYAVRVDDVDNIIVAGEFSGTLDLGGGPLGGTGASFFVAQFGPDGVHQWSRWVSVTGSEFNWGVSAIALSEVGGFSAVGIIDGNQPVDFGGGPLVGNDDLFIASFDAAGAHVWSRAFASTDFVAGAGIVADLDGNTLVTGWHRDPIDLGGGMLGGNGMFVVKYSAVGAHLWSMTAGNSSGTYGTGIASDMAGNVVVTGQMIDTIDLGGGPLVGAGGGDAYMAKFGPDGAHQWSRAFGDANWQQGGAVALDEEGAVLVGGFAATIDLGGGPLQSVHDNDSYVAKFTADPVAVAISSFVAKPEDGSVRIEAAFRSDLGVDAVRLYRGEGARGPLELVATVRDVGSERLEYIDDGVSPGRTYRYQIGVVDGDGEFMSLVVVVSIESFATELGQNIPNPFNPSTAIPFVLADRQHVTIVVYDASGRPVRVLVDEMREAGKHETNWDGRDDRGVPVAAGVYFYRLRAGKFLDSRKTLLLK